MAVEEKTLFDFKSEEIKEETNEKAVKPKKSSAKRSSVSSKLAAEVKELKEKINDLTAKAEIKLEKKPLDEDKVKEPEIYHRILFRNLYEPGQNLSFTYNGLSFKLIDNAECELRDEIVKHLNSLMIKTSHFIHTHGAHASGEKVYDEKPRVICQIFKGF